MNTIMGRLVDKYGSTLHLEQNGEERRLRGLLQPLLSRREPNRVYSPAGEIPRGRYLYIGPVEPAVAEGDVLSRNGRSFQIRQAELLYLGDTPVYCWAMCVEKGR